MHHSLYIYRTSPSKGASEGYGNAVGHRTSHILKFEALKLHLNVSLNFTAVRDA